MTQNLFDENNVRVKLIHHLNSFCNNYSCYESEEKEVMELENKAREGLMVFYKVFKSLKFNIAEYNRGRFHTSYLLQLIPIERALKNKQYRLACHELETLLYYEPFLQPRIYYNIVEVLKNNLDWGNDR